LVSDGSDGSRIGLYIKAGFKKKRILEAGVGGLYDIDVFIMYKCLVGRGCVII
jgi:hypothetical protein